MERFERKHLIVASSLVMGVLGITFGFARVPWLIVTAGFLLTATSNVLSRPVCYPDVRLLCLGTLGDGGGGVGITSVIAAMRVMRRGRRGIGVG